MSKQNRFFKPLSVALAAVLAIGSLAGCGESETEKQARLYREYIANGGNPIPQVQAPMAPAAPVQAPTTVVVQQDSGVGDVLLGAAAGAAAGALAANMMSPRYQGESDYAYRERQKRWDAEYAARQARQRELDARRENDRLRAQMAQQQNDRLRAQAPAFQTAQPAVPPAAAQPAVPQKTQNPAMFAQPPKEGQNFSRQQPMPAQPSIPAVQKPSGGGMFGSAGGTSRSSSSSSSRSSSRSK